MKYIDEFRDRELVKGVINDICELVPEQEITFMEVCGTHTMAIFRYGIRELIPKNIRLISGPGCPVCVTSNKYLDKAIAYSRMDGMIIATFGDMIRVPGSSSSLEKERAMGSDIRVVYSTLDAIKIAEENPDKNLIFLGIGFETTAPTIAVSIMEAKGKDLNNYFIFCANKLIPPAMETLINDGKINIDGFICPGHVSTIIGSKPYNFIAKQYSIPCAIAGFEPLDILYSIYLLVKHVRDGRAEVEIQYKRSVREEGNTKAKGLIEEVFEICHSEWRGLGIIENSGLKLREQYKEFDVEEVIQIEVEEVEGKKSTEECICGEILKGLKAPIHCRLFGKTCIPEDPKGPCMVSSEGTCSVYYKYHLPAGL